MKTSLSKPQACLNVSKKYRKAQSFLAVASILLTWIVLPAHSQRFPALASPLDLSGTNGFGIRDLNMNNLVDSSMSGISNPTNDAVVGLEDIRRE